MKSLKQLLVVETSARNLVKQGMLLRALLEMLKMMLKI